MLKRHEVQVLLRAGHSQEDVARLASVPLRTVQRIAKESAVAKVDDAQARVDRLIGRPSTVEGFRNLVVAILAEEPALLSVEILRRARLKGYTGGKSALYGLIASVRPADVKVETRFEGLAGEFTQHDFGQVDVHFMDATVQRVHFFATRWKYSRWTQVTLVENQSVEPLVRTLVDHFDAVGGIPLLAVFDRPKTVALEWRKDGTVTRWNAVFAQVVFELGLGVEVCWPYSPEQKGSVENLVGWVKGSFFKQRRFLDKDDLRTQLTEWHHEVNEVRPSRATKTIPAVRMAEERPRMRPLKVRPEALALRIPVSVGPTGYVLHNGHPYSMSPEAIGAPATLYLYRDRVRIVAGRHVSEHGRMFAPGQGSTHPEHRAQRLAEVSGIRGKRYSKRQDLFETGPAAVAYLTEVVHRRPNAWYQDVDDLHDLLQAAGVAVLQTAFQKALDAKVYGAEYVARFVRELMMPRQEELPL